MTLALNRTPETVAPQAIPAVAGASLRVPLVTLDQDQLSRTAMWVTARMP